MFIVEYDPDWVKSFAEIKSEFQKHLLSYYRIEHVGSTSIPGMKAKPIIDIDIEILSNDLFCTIKRELEEIGYTYCGNQGINDREVFKRNNAKKNPILDKIKHHLYVCSSQSIEYWKHIRFRNFLRNNTEYVFKYNEIKDEIIKKTGFEDRKKYVEIKEREYGWFFDLIINLSVEEEKKNHPTIAST